MSVWRAGAVADWPRLGFGAGLRAEHYDDVLAGTTGVEWFEAISENYMDTNGRPLAVLEAVRRDHPVALHGVALSIGSADPLDSSYLEALAALARRIEPAIVSDHLCWSSVDGRALFDLLPLPLTEECLEHVAARVQAVQEVLGRRILLENPSTYLAWKSSHIPEPEFLAELAERADCGLLLDVNNVYVSSVNLGFDPVAYLDAIPAHRVGQVHLAGFTDLGTHLFDTHSRPVHDEVWRLYAHTLERMGPVTTMVEWDDDIPPGRGWSKRSTTPAGSTIGCSPCRRSTVSPSLAELQRAVAAHILSGDGPTVDDWIRVPAGVDVATRLAVHTHGYPARVTESLREAFPATANILGDGSFAALAARYLAHIPAELRNLNDVGAALPAFLRSDGLRDDLPFLPDLAALEWAVTLCFHAKLASAFDASVCSGWGMEDWARARIEFQPGLALVRSPWPLRELRETRHSERSRDRRRPRRPPRPGARPSTGLRGGGRVDRRGRGGGHRALARGSAARRHHHASGGGRCRGRSAVRALRPLGLGRSHRGLSAPSSAR